MSEEGWSVWMKCQIWRNSSLISKTSKKQKDFLKVYLPHLFGNKRQCEYTVNILCMQAVSGTSHSGQQQAV